MHLSRRDLLLASAGAASTWGLRAQAQAAAEKPAVVLIFLQGSYNALFSAADAYVPDNLFGCTASNVRDLGNGLVVDAATLGTLPDPVLQQMCTVGIKHGSSGHDFARRYAWFDGRQSFPVKLADALGGSAAFRCVHFGQAPGDGAPHPSLNGVVMTAVPDLSAAVTLSTPSAGAAAPRRDLMARALRSSLATGADRFAKSPGSLRTTWDGTHTLIGALEQPAPGGVDWLEISAAYGIPSTELAATTFTSQLAGAELMVRNGADVVAIPSSRVGGENWDTHGDGSGELSRAMMLEGILPALSVFLQRTLAMPGRNVVTVLWGEFARTGGVPGRESGHANGTSATVFGKYVLPGTTGRPTAPMGRYVLPGATPNHQGFWSFLTAAAKAPSHPWGPNQHPTLLRST